MYRVFWDKIFFLIGYLLAYGEVRGNAAAVKSMGVTSTTVTTTVTTTISNKSETSYLFTYGQMQDNSTPLTTMEMSPTTVTTTVSTTISRKADTSTTNVLKKLIAAAVHSHFSDCPDSHSHFCFHGTCRFLILEKIPACVCQPGFIGMRCEHADLLAVVATNHKQDTVATMLMLCILGSVLVILVCSIINCWWRRCGGCRQGPILRCYSENPNRLIKRESFCHQSERVV